MSFSIKKLVDAFQVSFSVAKKINKAMKMSSDQLEDEFLSAKERIRECYSKPTTLDIQLHVLNDLIGGFGVEYIGHKDDSYTRIYGLDYINLGDTYRYTIIFDHAKGKFILSTIGDLIEGKEDKYI